MTLKLVIYCFHLEHHYQHGFFCSKFLHILATSIKSTDQNWISRIVYCITVYKDLMLSLANSHYSIVISKLIIHNQSIRRYFSVVIWSCVCGGFLVGVSKLLHTCGELMLRFEFSLFEIWSNHGDTAACKRLDKLLYYSNWWFITLLFSEKCCLNKSSCFFNACSLLFSSWCFVSSILSNFTFITFLFQF